jgi:uncharacterized protein (TIGR03083 family)
VRRPERQVRSSVAVTRFASMVSALVPPRPSYPTYLDHIRTESARFRDVLAGCDPTARVPGCPDWDASDLLWHLTGVQWFWARIIRLRPAAPDDDAGRPERPEAYAALLEVFDACSADLVAQLEAADPAEEAWHWSDDHTVGTTFRRQAHEALIHRLDAEQTAGQVTALDAELAADGVMELFEVMYGGEPPAWGRFEPGDGLVRVELTDRGQEIWVRPGMFFGTDPKSQKNYDGPHLVLSEAGEAAVQVRGEAAALDAWLWRRRDEDGLEVSGDPEVYAAFRAAVGSPLD